MDWNCRDWTAVHDHQPIGPLTLYVTGVCEMPTPGYTCELTVHEPQGINPKDLLLDLEMTEPSGEQPDVVTPCDVRFEWETDTEYDTVSIIDVQLAISVEHPE